MEVTASVISVPDIPAILAPRLSAEQTAADLDVGQKEFGSRRHQRPGSLQQKNGSKCTDQTYRLMDSYGPNPLSGQHKKLSTTDEPPSQLHTLGDSVGVGVSEASMYRSVLGCGCGWPLAANLTSTWNHSLNLVFDLPSDLAVRFRVSWLLVELRWSAKSDYQLSQQDVGDSTRCVSRS